MLVTIQRISGRQQIESRMLRAAGGVGSGYEKRSTLASGLVKKAKSPATVMRTEWRLMLTSGAHVWQNPNWFKWTLFQRISLLICFLHFFAEFIPPWNLKLS